MSKRQKKTQMNSLKTCLTGKASCCLLSQFVVFNKTSLSISIDYSLLLIFLGTFIVVENLDSTGLPALLWDSIVGNQPFKTFSSVVGINLFVLIASQLIGNVAVIFIAMPMVSLLPDTERRFAWATISFVATVGGNLTITGSAANIIVAEKARRLGETVDFFNHYNVCFWITLFSCALGMVNYHKLCTHLIKLYNPRVILFSIFSTYQGILTLLVYIDDQLSA